MTLKLQLREYTGMHKRADYAVINVPLKETRMYVIFGIFGILIVDSMLID